MLEKATKNNSQALPLLFDISFCLFRDMSKFDPKLNLKLDPQGGGGTQAFV